MADGHAVVWPNPSTCMSSCSTTAGIRISRELRNLTDPSKMLPAASHVMNVMPAPGILRSIWTSTGKIRPLIVVSLHGTKNRSPSDSSTSRAASQNATESAAVIREPASCRSTTGIGRLPGIQPTTCVVIERPKLPRPGTRRSATLGSTSTSAPAYRPRRIGQRFGTKRTCSSSARRVLGTTRRAPA